MIGDDKFSEDESASDEEPLDDVDNLKENKKNVTPAQIVKLFSFMNGRAGFTKGKMKHTEETTKLFDEWEKLTSELNTMGPPCHSSSKWRRVWTRLKSKKKMKISPSSSVLRSQDDNRRIKGQSCSTSSLSDPINPTSSTQHPVHGNVIVTKDDVESDHIATQMLFVESISKTIDSFVKSQEQINEELNKKIDLVIEQQASANKTVDSFVKNQELINEELIKKIDLVIEQQATGNVANEKLICMSQILADIFGEDVN